MDADISRLQQNGRYRYSMYRDPPKIDTPELWYGITFLQRQIAWLLVKKGC